MSAGVISCGEGGRGKSGWRIGLTTLSPSCAEIQKLSRNSGRLNLLESCGPLEGSIRIALPVPLQNKLVIQCMTSWINSSYVFIFAAMFYPCFASGSVERRFLISNLPTGNRTLCHEQHVASEPRAERPALKTKWKYFRTQCSPISERAYLVGRFSGFAHGALVEW
jgi:hypothetical protein